MFRQSLAIDMAHVNVERVRQTAQLQGGLLDLFSNGLKQHGDDCKACLKLHLKTIKFAQYIPIVGCKLIGLPIKTCLYACKPCQDFAKGLLGILCILINDIGQARRHALCYRIKGVFDIVLYSCDKLHEPLSARGAFYNGFFPRCNRFGLTTD